MEGTIDKQTPSDAANVEDTVTGVMANALSVEQLKLASFVGVLHELKPPQMMELANRFRVVIKDFVEFNKK